MLSERGNGILVHRRASRASARLAVLVTLLVPLAAFFLVTGAFAQTSVPGFSKSFSPNTIGPGSVSSLRFDVSNSSSLGVRNLTFSDTLPSGVTIASPADVLNECGGAVSAPSGGSTISLSGGQVGASQSCSITVNVTSSTPGTHINVSGDLTSDAGNSGSATANLTVTTARPGFRKSFSPSSIFLGGRSRLTLTLDNSANSSQVFNLGFIDTLPSGMVIATPANVAKTCTGGTLTAPAGGSTISLSPIGSALSTLAAGATCTISVDVTASAAGALGNVTGDLTSTTAGPLVSSGMASAVLNVGVEQLTLSKTFVDDPVPPGGTVILSFIIRSLSRDATATNIAFTDDLDATLSGLTAIALPSNPCGAGSSLTGSSVLSLTGASLAPGDSCTFSVTLQVPSSAASGSFTNTTSAITGDVGGTPFTGNAASDELFVEPTPLLTKSFLDDPVGGGDSVTLEFTITNTSADFSATDITFVDPLPIVLQSASSLPASGFCGAGSTLTFTPPTLSNPAQILVLGGSLAASASCTFSVTLGVVAGAPGGTHTNTTGEITATIDGETVTGNPASDDLILVRAPQLFKQFTDDPVQPGGTVTLEFTLEYDELAEADATGITFSDDLDATLSGLVATGLPQSDVCGTGSSLSGTQTLLLTGGTLAPGGTCTFSVTLSVPSSATPGPLVNTTSAVVATVSGLETTGNAATDTLRVGGLTLSKEFLDDPVQPGGTVTLRFTVENTSATDTATAIFFQDDLNAALSNLAATGLPLTDPCGSGSQLISLNSNRLLRFEGGTLAAGTSCTFDVTLQVPSGAASDSYRNVTSGFSANFGGTVVFFDNALDFLTVDDNFLALTKEFIDDPVAPGDTATLELTLTNLSDTDPVSSIAFTDDLDAALSGLASISGTLSDVCGTASQISGTSVLSLTGGNLAAGEVCTFTVVVLVPEDTPFGTLATNTTSEVAGTLGGLPVFGAAATADLQVDALQLSKSFGSIGNPGSTVTLLFQLESASGTPAFSDLSFNDDLDAVIPGLQAIGLPATGVCGAGSVLSGTSFLTLTDGSLLPGGSCSFSVTLQIPVTAEAGAFVNITSDVTQGGLSVAAPATDNLVIEAVVDTDGDDVLDGDDLCPGTVIPEATVPSRSLGVNRFALVDADTTFDTVSPRGRGPQEVFTTTDTGGCSCEQIIDALGLGNGHSKFGCSLGAMRDWASMASSASTLGEIQTRPYEEDRGTARRLGVD